MGFTQKYIANGTTGNRTAPLTNIKTTIYGMVSDGKDFPTCSLAKIQAAGSDTGCPKGALVASGSITAAPRTGERPECVCARPLPCDPLLDVWNAGQGKVVYFFVDQGSHTLRRRRRPDRRRRPFPGTVKTVGKNLVMNTPIPSYVSFPLTAVRGLAHQRDPDLEEPEHEAQERQDRALRYVGRLQGRQAPLQRDVHRGIRPRRRAVSRAP